METSTETQALFEALAKAQAQMGTAQFDAKNPHYRSSYASLSSVLGAILPSWNEHGLSLMQHPHFDGQLVSLTTIVTHASGQWMKSVCAVPIGKRGDAHALGSAISYLRRYSAAAVSGLIQGDDDGNAAVVQPRRQVEKPAPRPAEVSLGQVVDACNEAELSIDDLLRWCKGNSRPDPKDMSQAQRAALVRWLRSDKGSMVRAWFQAQSDAASDAPAGVPVPSAGGEG
jgi:hypothetical protein